MNKAYLLIGGNLGDRAALQESAMALIDLSPSRITQRSSLYETAAWGKTDQPSFFNRCICVETELMPESLLERLLEIETSLGRIRTEKFGPRTVDIDILLYNDLILETDQLSLPHPGLPQRRFALEPLNELAPHLLHPSLQLTISELLASCKDPLEVKKIS